MISLQTQYLFDYGEKQMRKEVAMFKSSKKHLESVEESYLEHQGVAFRYALNCLKAAFMAFIHGLVPGLFPTSASELIKKLAENRHNS